MTGRPTIPNELKQQRGTYRPGRQQGNATTQELLSPGTIPTPLRELDTAGLYFWQTTWTAGLLWISPQTDIHLMQLVAEQFDERQQLRDQVLEHGEPRDRANLRELEKHIASNLGNLGLNPSERSRLGFAIVKTESKLEALFEKKAARQQSIS